MTNVSDAETYKTVHEFATKYRLAPSTVRGHLHYRRFGLFPTKVGGRVLISATAERAFLHASEKKEAA